MRDFSVVKIESVDCGSSFINGESSLEEDIKACRVCLTTKGKLFNLHANNLAETFGDISGTPVATTDGHPQYACVKCRALLLKCLAFRLCCQQTVMQLQHLRLQTAPVTTELISTLQRTEIVPLVLTKTLNLEYLPTTEEVQSPITSVQRHEKLVEVVKNESFIALSPVQDNLIEDDSHFDDDFKVDNDDNNFKVDELLGNIHEAEIVDAENVKLENDVENTDVSYSPRKGKKRKKTPVKNVKVKKKPMKKLKKIETEDEITDSEVKLEKMADKPIKKKLYNRKTEEDFVSFSKTFNVEVVFLTQEQQIEQVQSRKDCEDFINSRFQCDKCYKSFMKESAFMKHMVTHDPSTGTHVCDICFVRFPVRHKLMKHQRRHKTHFICKFCSQISKDSTMAKMHYKWHEGFKYNCQHCGRSFSKPSSYMNHVREHHSPITCDVCQQAVSGTRGLAAHKADAHSRMHKCPTCAMEFHSPAALARHGGVGVAGVGVGVAPRCGALAPCARCGAELLTADALANHLETEHGDKVYRCELCKTTYASDRQLGIHWSRAHKGQRRAARARDDHYMCELCANSYPNETTLRYHQRIHTGERPFQCPMCPKKFRLKTNLQVHLNTHTGARPYKCPLCPETFKSYSQKHKHRLLVHTKERRHKCHMCEKTYVVSFDLKTHIRTAHMKIPLPPRARRSDRRRDNPSVSNTNININN